MNISEFFIKKPVFCTVLISFIILIGLLSLNKIPLRQFPDIERSEITIDTIYPGAASNIVETKITEIIEAQISGIDGIESISSVSRDGRSKVTIEFIAEKNINEAANDVRDAVSRILENLPKDSESPEISKIDSDGNAVMWLNLTSDDITQLELTDYAERYLVDRLSVIPGVAKVRISGGKKKSLRVWLNPDLLSKYKISVLDIEKQQKILEKELTISANLSANQYKSMVKTAKEYIKNGDIFQVVLSQRFSIPFSLSPMALYRSLRRLNPSPFLYCFHLKNLGIVGSSPEILVRLRNGEVTIRPIAGTRKRGESAIEDQENAAELLGDIKERAEHLMLLDLGRNDVGRVSASGAVQVVSNFEVEYYSHVMHVASEVRGKIRPEFDAIDALMAGFPAGTVSGAPKIRAMEIIEELEPDKRGIYAGAIGYIGAAGEMDTCIALRTAIIEDNKMHIQAGAGIVYDSDPKSEFEECQNKARALFRAAEDAIKLSKEN